MSSLREQEGRRTLPLRPHERGLRKSSEKDKIAAAINAGLWGTGTELERSAYSGERWKADPGRWGCGKLAPTMRPTRVSEARLLGVDGWGLG